MVKRRSGSLGTLHKGSMGSEPFISRTLSAEMERVDVKTRVSEYSRKVRTN